ncbi:MAG: hypothetical protein RLZZ367_1801 [Bacteroidota bacterium]|jgi:hypothetical protein
MDQNIKNFDRNIEQMMNEAAVEPPFGMWNRIAADLDAAEAVATPAAGTPVPQRSVAAMLVGVMVIGASLVTAYMVNTNNNQQLTTAANVSQPTEITTPVAEQPIVTAIETPKTIAALPVQKAQPAKRSVVAKTAKETPAAPQQLAKVTEPVFVPTEINNNTTNQVDVLVPLVAVDQNKQQADAYYFPPVDIYTGENKMQENKLANAAKVRTEKTTEREASSSSESSSSSRLKFRPKKHGRYNYGKINRTHSRRN